MPTLQTAVTSGQRLMNKPLTLLIMTGILLGATLPVARLASGAGWSPIPFTFWAALGSGLILLIAGRRGRMRLSAHVAKYSLIAGILGVALPNSLAFVVMPGLGTTTTSLAYTLPPLFTYAFGWMAGMERYRAGRLTGVLLGMAGAGLLVLGKPAHQAAPGAEVLLALGIPLSVAAGNVYRKRYLPEGYDAPTLAGSMLVAGAAALLPLLLASDPGPGGSTDWPLVLLQCTFTSLGYLVYFRFQKVADPVYFSQLGYVMSATGVLGGVLLFGEKLTPWMPVAVAVIAAGVVLVNRRPAQALA